MSYPLNKVPKATDFILYKSKLINCKQGAVRSVRYNVDGNYCITCGSDKSVKLWNPHKGLLLTTYGGHGYEVLDAQGSSDSGQIVSGGKDKLVFVWDVGSGQAVRRLRGHAAQVNCVKFNEASSVVLSGSLDGTVRVWDCKSKNNNPIQILNEAKDSVTSLQVSDKEILTGSLDCCIRRYDIRKGQMTTDNLQMPVSSVSFTHDGQCVLASCMDSSLKLIDKDTGEVLAKYTGHKNTEYRIDSTVSASDAQVLSGSEDGIVYCWDLVESQVVCKLEHACHKVVHSLSFHPRLCQLLTAAEASVYVWTDTKPKEESQ